MIEADELRNSLKHMNNALYEPEIDTAPVYSTPNAGCNHGGESSLYTKAEF